MKKLLVAFVMALATSSSLFASYSGNPAQPSLTPKGVFGCNCADWFSNNNWNSGNNWNSYNDCCDSHLLSNVKLVLGYERDVVSDRKLKSTNQRFRINEFGITADQGIATLVLCNWLEVYGGVGGARFTFSLPPNEGAATPQQARANFQTFDKTCYSVGGRADLYESECGTVFGITGNWFHAEPLLEWDDLHVGATSTQAKLHYNEWQVGLGIAQRVGIFTPYAVAKYSAVKGQVKNLLANQVVTGTPITAVTYDSFNIRSRHHFGAAFGVTLACYEGFFLNFEARVFDERAYTVEAGLAF